MLLRSLKLYPLLESGLEKEVDNRTVLVEGDKKTHLPAKVNGDPFSKGLRYLKKKKKQIEQSCSTLMGSWNTRV